MRRIPWGNLQINTGKYKMNIWPLRDKEEGKYKKGQTDN